MLEMALHRLILPLLLSLPFISSSGAADYPVRPVHVIVPYAAAGTMDIASRILFQKVAELLGHPFVVDNRPGAGGNIGLEQVVNSNPAGYTLGVADPMTSLSANVSLMPELAFNPVKDLVPVANFGSTGVAVIVPASLSVKSLPEFIELAKKQTGPTALRLDRQRLAGSSQRGAVLQTGWHQGRPCSLPRRKPRDDRSPYGPRAVLVGANPNTLTGGTARRIASSGRRRDRTIVGPPGCADRKGTGLRRLRCVVRLHCLCASRRLSLSRECA